MNCVAIVVAVLLISATVGSNEFPAVSPQHSKISPEAAAPAAAAGKPGGPKGGKEGPRRVRNGQVFVPISDADLELEHATWSEGHDNMTTVEKRLKELKIPEPRVFRTIVFGYPDHGVLQMTCDRILDKSNWFSHRSVKWASPGDLSSSPPSSSQGSDGGGGANNTTFVNSKSMPLGLFYFAGHTKHEASAMILMCVPFGVENSSSISPPPSQPSSPHTADLSVATTITSSTTTASPQNSGEHLHPNFLYPIHTALVDIFRYSPTSAIAVMPLEHDSETDALHVSHRSLRSLIRLHKTIPVLFDLMVVALVVPADKDGDPILEDADAVSTLPSAVAADLRGDGTNTAESLGNHREAELQAKDQKKKSIAWKGFEAIRMEARVTQQLRRLMAPVAVGFMPYFVYSSGPIAAQQKLHQVAAWRRKQQTRTAEAASLNHQGQSGTSSDAVVSGASTSPSSGWVHTDVDLLAILIAFHSTAHPIPNRKFPSDHRVAFREMSPDGKSAAVEVASPPNTDSEQHEVNDYKFVTATTYHDFHFGHFLKKPSQELESLVTSARKGSSLGRPFHKLFVGDDPDNLLGDGKIISSEATLKEDKTLQLPK